MMNTWNSEAYAHTYRYYVRRAPFMIEGRYTEHRFAVYCGEIDGPNVSFVSVHWFFMIARLVAWWRNLRRSVPTADSHFSQTEKHDG